MKQPFNSRQKSENLSISDNKQIQYYLTAANLNQMNDNHSIHINNNDFHINNQNHEGTLLLSNRVTIEKYPPTASASTE